MPSYPHRMEHLTILDAAHMLGLPSAAARQLLYDHQLAAPRSPNNTGGPTPVLRVGSLKSCLFNSCTHGVDVNPRSHGSTVLKHHPPSLV